MNVSYLKDMPSYKTQKMVQNDRSINRQKRASQTPYLHFGSRNIRAKRKNAQFSPEIEAHS
jgi:hypothetical protein